MVSLVRSGATFNPQDPAYNFCMGMIDEFKPDRIIFIYSYALNWRCIGQKDCGNPDETKYYEEAMRKFESDLK